MISFITGVVLGVFIERAINRYVASKQRLLDEANKKQPMAESEIRK